VAESKRPYIIAIEEHYWDKEVVEKWGSGEGSGPPVIREKLFDLYNERIKSMDAAGIDVQVLSLGAPSTQRFDAKEGPAIARGANDRLAEVCKRHPERFKGFAALPTANPEAAADELERCVKDHGFKGAMIHGLSYGQKFIDLPEFWPIFARAEKLDVPIYLHPAMPHPAIVEAYLKDHLKEYPGLTSAAWGFTIETATAGLRMVLSRVFEKHPNLKIILGHMGEGLPFLLWRIDMALARPGGKSLPFRETFRKNFWITTSGNFSDAALICSVMEMGADRIIFSIDYPYVENQPGVDWMKHIPLATEDREKIYNGTAKKLLKM
jgi:2,3-dihydroxybenzoate decarboxylase